MPEHQHPSSDETMLLKAARQPNERLWLQKKLILGLLVQHTMHAARAGEIHARGLANIALGAATAVAKMSQLDEELFAALALEAQLRVSEFNPQELANTAWAFAKVGQEDKQLFAALAKKVLLQVSEFNAQNVANTAWAFAKVDQLDE